MTDRSTELLARSFEELELLFSHSQVKTSQLLADASDCGIREWNGLSERQRLYALGRSRRGQRRRHLVAVGRQIPTVIPRCAG